jgi:hypothetical protein
VSHRSHSRRRTAPGGPGSSSPSCSSCRLLFSSSKAC